jgi:hypothetical protein
MVGVAGEIWMALSVAAVTLTVILAEPKKPPEVAVTVADPLFTAVATPAAVTETALVLDEDQIAVAVRSLVELSE